MRPIGLCGLGERIEVGDGFVTTRGVVEQRMQEQRRWSPHLLRTRHFAVEQSRKRAWPVFSATVEALRQPSAAGEGSGAGEHAVQATAADRHEALRRAGWDEADPGRREVRTFAEWCTTPACSPREHLAALLDVLRIAEQDAQLPPQLPPQLPSGLGRPAAVAWLTGHLRAQLDRQLESGGVTAEDYGFVDEVIAKLAAQSPVGDRLRAARRAAGLSQGDLAEALGAHVASVMTWERAARPVDARYRARLCELLSLGPDDLD